MSCSICDHNISNLFTFSVMQDVYVVKETASCTEDDSFKF